MAKRKKSEDKPMKKHVCGAKTSSGNPCQKPPLRGKKRCKLHGGASTGAPKGNTNGVRHGLHCKDPFRRLMDPKNAEALDGMSPADIETSLLKANADRALFCLSQLVEWSMRLESLENDGVPPDDPVYAQAVGRVKTLEQAWQTYTENISKASLRLAQSGKIVAESNRDIDPNQETEAARRTRQLLGALLGDSPPEPRPVED